MNNSKLIKNTFNNEFDQETYEEFLTELLNQPIYEQNNLSEQIDKGFQEYVESVSDYGTFEDIEQEEMKLYVVKLKRTSSLERARTMQRNFIAKLLSNDIINNALVAFYGDNSDWRFSFIKIYYTLDENGKIIKKLSPAKRHSYLVGPTQSNHTCQQQFLKLIKKEKISIEEINESFEIENVTDEFFNEYKELFHLLTEEINNLKEIDLNVKEELENKSIKSSDFAKKILGQIVFIYFIQKKGWLGVAKDQKWGEGSKNFIKKLYNKEYFDYDNFFNDVLEPLFYEGLSTSAIDNHYAEFNCKVPFINGGIFENINNYDWVKTDLNIDNKVFEMIINTFDKFNFTVKEDEPLEKEVAIDPEMLGKVFEKLLEVNERKDKGAFYTPRHIVHEICQETLISYLETNTEDIPRKDIEIFIKEGYLAIDSIIRVQEEQLDEYEANKQIPLPNSIIAQIGIIEDLLNDVKVVDPAVGSGAFPVGMLTEIVQAKHIIQLLEGYDEVNMYDLKRETIENSLYAVDISYSATDITKLRFWLSLIVDEESIENIRPLPNLDNKIMCGNSIIDVFEGINLFDKNLLNSSKNKQTKLFDPTGLAFKKLLNYKSQYFNENTHEEKIKLKKRIQDTKWKFIEESIQENIKKGTKQEKIVEMIEKIRNYKYAESKPFFIWELEFSEIFTNENPGFDIVIGNPPYVRHQRIVDFKKYLKKYEVYNGRADLYVYFFEKGLKILKKDGHLSYICSNKFVISDYGTELRELIIKKQINNYVDYTSENIFKGVSVDTSVITIKNTNVNLSHKIFINKEYYLEQSRLNNTPWIIAKPEELNVKDKIQSKGLPLKEVIGGINKGLLTGYNKAFIIDKNTRDKLINEDNNSINVIKPVIVGKNVKRYKINYENKYILYLPWDIDIDKYPAIKNHMLQFKEKLSNRTEVKNGRINWWVLRRYAPKYSHEFEMPKIIYPEIGDRLYATFSEEPYYMNNKCFMITESELDLKYLSALLSSKVLDYFFRLSGYNLKNKGIVLLKMYIENLPIPIISNEEQNTFIELVNKILCLNKKLNENNNINLKNQIKILDNELEEKIYELYDLSKEDIKIIEKYYVNP